MYRFIRNHILTIMTTYQQELKQQSHHLAFDRFLSNYFRQHKSIGSNERSEISQKVYSLLRYNVLLDQIVKNGSWDDKLEMIFSRHFYQMKEKDERLPLWTKCSQNKELFDMLAKDLGQRRAYDLSEIMNHRAPLTIRVNPLMITRQQFVKKWKKQALVPTEFSPYGLRLIQKKQFNLLQTEEFKNGLFEIQDEGSQLAALEVKAQPGQLVLDFCAGSGGKSLTIGHLLQNRGQLFLHEPRSKALSKAKIRMQRAGLRNVQFHNDEETLMKTARGKMDWLILDVPCTGTGTLRRNPDIKMKFSKQWLQHCLRLQQSIVQKSLKYLRKDGQLVYITCSLLKQQNQMQIEHFRKKFGLKLVNNRYLSILPQPDGMDGFFAATLSL